MNIVPIMTVHSIRRFASRLVTLASAVLGIAVASAQAPAPSEPKPAVPEVSPATPAAPGAKGATKRQRRPAPEPEPAPAATAEPSPLAPLAWLEGCWSGTLNRREVREHWLPLRGNVLLGISHTVLQGKTQDYEYLRIESRPDGIYYVALPSGENPTSFKFAEKTVIPMGDRNDDAFVFDNTVPDFPQKLTYRHAGEGWLYVVLVGQFKGAEKEVTYPLHRIDCQTGVAISQ
jgi:hypothetical protein